VTAKPAASDLDLAHARWQQPPGVAPGGEAVEIAHIGRFVAMRSSGSPATPPLIFTPAEWDAFTAGVKDGEFDFGEDAT